VGFDHYSFRKLFYPRENSTPTETILRAIPDEFSAAVKWHSSFAIGSDHKRILQCNRNKKHFIELGLKSLVWIWVIFPLPTILVIFYNNTIIDLGAIHNETDMHKNKKNLPYLLRQFSRNWRKVFRYHRAYFLPIT